MANRRRGRLYTALTAPFEVVGLTIIYAFKGFMLGVENVRDAWKGE